MFSRQIWRGSRYQFAQRLAEKRGNAAWVLRTGIDPPELAQPAGAPHAHQHRALEKMGHTRPAETASMTQCHRAARDIRDRHELC